MFLWVFMVSFRGFISSFFLGLSVNFLGTQTICRDLFGGFSGIFRGFSRNLFWSTFTEFPRHFQAIFTRAIFWGCFRGLRVLESSGSSTDF